jgi:hypothetical protein
MNGVLCRIMPDDGAFPKYPPTPGPLEGRFFLVYFLDTPKPKFFNVPSKIPKAHYIPDLGRYSSDFIFNFFLFFFTTFYKYDEYGEKNLPEFFL